MEKTQFIPVGLAVESPNPVEAAVEVAAAPAAPKREGTPVEAAGVGVEPKDNPVEATGFAAEKSSMEMLISSICHPGGRRHSDIRKGKYEKNQ